MKNSVFQYVLFYNPTEGATEIISSGFITAPNQDRARLLASRRLESRWDDKINDVEVLVRPF